VSACKALVMVVTVLPVLSVALKVSLPLVPPANISTDPAVAAAPASMLVAVSVVMVPAATVAIVEAVPLVIRKLAASPASGMV